MKRTWKNFEDRIRSVASYVWNADAKPDRIAGVNIDCYIRAADDHAVLIEITEERDVQKVRGDVIKLISARNELYNNEKLMCRCFCVVDADTVTQGMIDAGKTERISVLTGRQFERLFFPADDYSVARAKFQFGSAVNPATGEKDDTDYVPVQYTGPNGKEYNVNMLADILLDGRNIVLLGEYGSGKSRCLRELFFDLETRKHQNPIYPIAIDLRKNWGLSRGPEIIRRHLDEMGVSQLANPFFRAMPSGAFTFLLDGFDKIGSQAWSQDGAKLRAIRADSLSGVKDLVRSVKSGFFISGREHYFDNNEEMFSALGLKPDETIILRVRTEFTSQEMEEYFNRLGSDTSIPSWLPKRPLICRTISSMPAGDVERVFSKESGDVEFWHRFMQVVCERDALIHPTFDGKTIYEVLKQLAHLTRVKDADMGPLSIAEIQSAFAKVLFQAPIEQASLMLQRLPDLGRLKSESDDRQFIDLYVLDGLRATALDDALKSHTPDLDSTAWRNPLGRLGQRILADHIGKTGAERRYVQTSVNFSIGKNKLVAADIVSAVVWLNQQSIDLKDIALTDTHFLSLNLSQSELHNITIRDSVLFEVIFPEKDLSRLKIQNCVIGKALGVTGEKGLPSWVESSSVDEYQSIQNVAQIRQIGLKPAQETGPFSSD